MRYDRLAVFLLLILSATQSPAADNIQPTGSWSGKFRDNTLQKFAPQQGFIATLDAWKHLWGAWRPGKTLPEVDFEKELILVGVVPGPNAVLLLPLNQDGKVTFAVGGTKKGGPGFGYKLVKIPRVGITSVQGKSLESTGVQGVVQIPSTVASFDKHQLEIKLWEYDPFLADAAAKLVDELRLKPFRHTNGKTTKTSFQVGTQLTPQANRRYYITVFILQDGKRTHIGERDGKSGLCKVLADGKPSTVNMVIRSVR